MLMLLDVWFFSLWCPPSNSADGRDKSRKVFLTTKKITEKNICSQNNTFVFLKNIDRLPKCDLTATLAFYFK